jgi:3-hydroxyacyl-CoA dehydrogenase
VEEGALPQQIDQVMEDFGFPMGRFKVSDLSGKLKLLLLERHFPIDVVLVSKGNVDKRILLL